MSNINVLQIVALPSYYTGKAPLMMKHRQSA